jgi:hypothetical protein
MARAQTSPCPELIDLLKALRIDLTACVSGEITIKFALDEIIELNIKTRNWANAGDLKTIGEFVQQFELHKKENNHG